MNVAGRSVANRTPTAPNRAGAGAAAAAADAAGCRFEARATRIPAPVAVGVAVAVAAAVAVSASVSESSSGAACGSGSTSRVSPVSGCDAPKTTCEPATVARPNAANTAACSETLRAPNKASEGALRRATP